MKVTAWCTAKWKDELLVWDKIQYGGSGKFYVHAEDEFDVWTPYIIVMNTIGDFVKLGNADFPMVVKSSGEVTMETGVSLSTHCDADITYYPFDTQSCDIVIGTVVYTQSQVNMTIEEILTENYRENGEWELVNLAGSRHEITLDEETETLLTLTLTLKRLRPFFLINLVVPLMLLSALNVVVFALPVESGERISLSITTLLTYAVFLSVIGDSLPNTSRSSPIVGVYVLSTFVLSVLAVCLSVLLLNLHGRQGETVPVCLQRAFRCRLCACLTSGYRGWNGKENANDPRGDCSYRKTGPAPEVVSVEKTEVVNGEEFPIEVHKGSRRIERGMVGVDVKKTAPGKLEPDVDWHTVARALDRIFFWSFLTVCMLVCLVVTTLWVSH
ncbi:neuronal acetylcholine receptor subunit alpha-6-like [Liolophura sinensis]|uniref:neuronal acetylcholine receptor subunit alpha-6-like n=1 Tax=Liolophura sinensis TaxID=3198878 RepID=UPI0031594676